jgi:AcrR family transcriptional regulator
MGTSAAVNYDSGRDHDPRTGAWTRRLPVQARSEARIQRILDATASIIAEHGLERVTTTLVAGDAGMSVGALYRYYPDRQGLILALARRNLDHYLHRFEAALRRDDVRTWADALDCAIDTFLYLHAHEVGFTRLRFGGWIEKQILGEPTGTNDSLAESFADLFVEQFGVRRSSDLVFHIQVASDIADALLTRAFAVDPAGDERLIEEARGMLHAYLQDRLSVDLPRRELLSRPA